MENWTTEQEADFRATEKAYHESEAARLSQLSVPQRI